MPLILPKPPAPDAAPAEKLNEAKDAAAPEAAKPGQAGPEREADEKQDLRQNGQAEAGERGQIQRALEAKLQAAEKEEAVAGGGGGFGGRARRMGLDDMVVNMVVVREYAHAVRPNRQPGQRQDFTETLFWNAGIKTDPKTGEANVTFALSDAVTSFKVLADAFDQSGTLGEAAANVESVEPFYLEPKLPLEVTTNDVIRLPVGLVNSTTIPLSDGTLKFNAKGFANLDISKFQLDADGRIRVLLPLTVGNTPGETDVVLSAMLGLLPIRSRGSSKSSRSVFPLRSPAREPWTAMTKNNTRSRFPRPSSKAV